MHAQSLRHLASLARQPLARVPSASGGSRSPVHPSPVDPIRARLRPVRLLPLAIPGGGPGAGLLRALIGTLLRSRPDRSTGASGAPQAGHRAWARRRGACAAVAPCHQKSGGRVVSRPRRRGAPDVRRRRGCPRRCAARRNGNRRHLDLRHALPAVEAHLRRGGGRQVDDAALHVGPSIANGHHRGLAGLEVGDLRRGAQRQRLAGGAVALQVHGRPIGHLAAVEPVRRWRPCPRACRPLVSSRDFAQGMLDGGRRGGEAAVGGQARPGRTGWRLLRRRKPGDPRCSSGHVASRRCACRADWLASGRSNRCSRQQPCRAALAGAAASRVRTHPFDVRPQ